MNRRTSLVLGVGIGLGLGLLLAPKSGEETRKDIVKTADTLAEKTKKVYHSILDKCSRKEEE